MADEEASAMVVDSVAPDAAVAIAVAAVAEDVAEDMDMLVADAVETTDSAAAAMTDRTAETADRDAAADAIKPPVDDDAVPVVENAPLVALTPEIRWHCGPTGLNEAVLSIDFLHPNSQQQQQQDNGVSAAEQHQPTILATGGADKEIKLWRVSDDFKDHMGLEFVFSLSGHDRSVNCVRFSPNGEFLASASDDSTIILWTKPKTAPEDWAWEKITSFSDVSRTLLACGHKGDITDLAWSPDSAFLCSTSVDNTSVIWNVEKGEVEERRKDHTQYVQGVAWDPLNEYLVTEGNDRSCRVYSLNGFDSVSRLSSKKVPKKCACIQTIKMREFPVPKSEINGTTASTATQPEKANSDTKLEDSKAAADTEPKQPTSGETATTTATAEDSAACAAAAPKHRMFLDDTCPAFARRPAWTPDGNYFLAPTGIFRSTESASPVNTVYAFARGNLGEPTLHLPGQEKASLGVRCSPLLYELRRPAATADSNDGTDAKQQPVHNFFQTPHRSIFAVITLNTVVIYDTQQAHPICTLKDLHYADLTDMSWSRDGQLLSISSMDGYLSFIKFQEGFFGTSVSKMDHVAMNQQKMCTMFATPKLTRAKKHKAAQAQQASADDVNGGGAGKKKMKVSTPAVRKKADVKASEAAGSVTPTTGAQPAQPAQQLVPSPVAGGVNTLQVRKKRKITPVLVTSSSPAAAATPLPAGATLVPVTDAQSSANTGTPSRAKQEAPSTTTESQAQQQTETASASNGSVEDPIML